VLVRDGADVRVEET
jgi:hypothetical protein